MSQQVAFLRAINVGGRTVRMDRLKDIFEEAGLADVSTFIASGNVIFDGGRARQHTLETRIERHLKAKLGWDVETFVRDRAQLETIAAATPFPDVSAGGTLYVAFAREELPAARRKAVSALGTDTDLLTTIGSEIYWLCLTRMSETNVGGAAIEKAAGSRVTVRNINTVHRILQKLQPAA